MKQSLISLVIGATMAFGAVAEDEAGATTLGALGNVTGEQVATGVVGLGVLAAIISNNRGSSDIVDPVDPDPTCNDGDELVDGVCVNTTVSVTDTVTVSGTQTITVTTPITVISTYAPTVQ
ncbi:hypothetical protein [Aestuariibacter sp. A3R04]|uniref:hypothetical protein n=1 Tax=Aestuariibacter sp. A3R04 TaxID=2841571 RepID=UPI001C09CB3B|nr:hypothetical protein [Aestuariibacter sp. A3R04]MBU3023861.1 hypothetical protein [Aestuariibacter sp. A3R04]